MIDYNILNNSLFYYKLSGFTHIDVPWIASPSTINLTKPADRDIMAIRDQGLVGSAEQSFLELISQDNLNYGKYVALTPCFRDEEKLDDIHHLYFMKTELIVYDSDINFLKSSYRDVLNVCKGFFDKYTTTNIIKSEDFEGNFCHDIIDTRTGIELGSYGIRSHGSHHWIYATGCAEPRLSYVIGLNSGGKGYHNEIISKEKVGTFFKVMEEVDEIKDSILTGNKVMELVELSDLYGAIELYIKNNYPGINMEDLNKMSMVTQRAFFNGKR